MAISGETKEQLQATSRTFFLPIMVLPEQLQEAVASAYLCFRAIDEIEDHPALSNVEKTGLLRDISGVLQTPGVSMDAALQDLFGGAGHDVLPEVTLRLGDWARVAPKEIAHRIWDATATMANRMAGWATVNWHIATRADLDRYTHSVAGAVGLLLSDLWSWFDGTHTDRGQAVAFGRGLQAVNILRNREEDLRRGVDFYPDGWTREELVEYSRQQLSLADEYNRSLRPGPVLQFCRIPLALAYATLDTLSTGQQKLSRDQVLQIVERIAASPA